MGHGQALRRDRRPHPGPARGPALDPGELLASTKGKRSSLHSALIEKLLENLNDDKREFVLGIVGDLVREFKKYGRWLLPDPFDRE